MATLDTIKAVETLFDLAAAALEDEARLADDTSSSAKAQDAKAEYEHNRIAYNTATTYIVSLMYANEGVKLDECRAVMKRIMSLSIPKQD